jgi:hypothetical protein
VVRTSVPDLRLYPLIVYRHYAGGELNTDRRPALEIELVAYESREHCGDKVSVAVLHSARLHTYSFYVVRKVITKSVSGHLTGKRQGRD